MIGHGDVEREFAKGFAHAFLRRVSNFTCRFSPANSAKTRARPARPYKQSAAWAKDSRPASSSIASGVRPLFPGWQAAPPPYRIQEAKARRQFPGVVDLHLGASFQAACARGAPQRFGRCARAGLRERVVQHAAFHTAHKVVSASSAVHCTICPSVSRATISRPQSPHAQLQAMARAAGLARCAPRASRLFTSARSPRAGAPYSAGSRPHPARENNSL